MRLLVLLLFFVAYVKSDGSLEQNGEKKIVCYFGSWAVYRHGNGQFQIPYIDPTLCTHIIYTFAKLGSDGTIQPYDPYADLPDNYGKDGYNQFNKLREKSPSTKTLIALGGWNEGSVKYSKVVSTAEGRAKLADSVLAFIKKWNFDGFDLDWEYPSQRGGQPEDKQNYVLLLKELRRRLNPEGLLLSVAVGASITSAEKSYHMPEIAKQVDFIALMTYDYHGASWESVLGIVAPLYASPEETGERATLNVNTSVHYWLSHDVPPEKIILGVPFYGQAFQLADLSQTKPGSPSAGKGKAGPYTGQDGILSYMEICEKFRNEPWVHEYEPYQRVPYSYRGNQWVGYDNIRSITEKSEYAQSLNLGGIMVWSIESDDFRGICGEKYPLLKTINHVLRKTPAPSTKPPPVFTTSNSLDTELPEWTTEGNNEPGDIICKGEGYTRDAEDCSNFYYCSPAGGEFIAHKFSCPAGLHFNLVILACDYPYNVDCTHH